MEPDGSITQCLDLIRQGDSQAAQTLWQRYFPRLVRVARDVLLQSRCHPRDEEDVALSAMDRFCRAAQDGRYPDLADRDGLWRLLLCITTNRALDTARRERRRGRGSVRIEADLEGGLGALAADGPSPEFAALMTDQCDRLLTQLDEDLAAMAIAKLEGYTNQEIADRLQCSVRTVERRLRLIRDLWRAEELSP